ncbi:hypothetical protein ES703_59576 [subsurface metagenome]
MTIQLNIIFNLIKYDIDIITKKRIKNKMDLLKYIRNVPDLIYPLLVSNQSDVFSNFLNFPLILFIEADNRL